MALTNKEIFTLLVCTDTPHKSDAAILLEGDGFSRIRKTCMLVKNEMAGLLVFSGGFDMPSMGSYPFSKCQPHIKAEGIASEKIIVEDRSLHTRQQAEYVIDMCIEKDWESIILVASHYHQFRAFLTFLKVLEEKRKERTIKIYNAPETDLSWFRETSWGRRIDLADAEFHKIEKYVAIGHVSTYENAIEYFQWRECSQH